MPKEYLKALAQSLDLSEETLTNAGMKFGVSREKVNRQRLINIIPLSRTLTELGIEVFTLESFIRVAEVLLSAEKQGIRISKQLIRGLLPNSILIKNKRIEVSGD